ncbi:MAG: UDP-2,4-diacetamido-2,4,6-trideoxy-beta-L-altropyranose hydrolase [Rhizobiales bacterium]|nr:UDP-2,4-diacetamido-2,4,6-trideoxy-beta-L-altropyranose hydrolase [Hyphomicrobiales bacterium]
MKRNKSAMQVLIRVDASDVIGTGHVMRCLVLADRLSEEGATCQFICRSFDGHLADLIATRGHHCYLLDADTGPTMDTDHNLPPPAHANWLGVNWQIDAKATIDIAEALEGLDLLIVDHYAIDHRWERLLKPYCKRLMVLDDLVDRRHCVDVLLDQNYGHSETTYKDLVPENCKVLAGAQFALLRRQFSAQRPAALARRRQVPDVKRLLIFLGGGATDEPLGRVAMAIVDANPQNLSAVTLIAGGARNADNVAGQLRSALNVPVEVFSNVEDMASLMVKADLAIGGGGVSGWERCALGLPSLVIALADNQRAINRQLSKDQYIFSSVEPDNLSRELMRRFLDMDDQTYSTISRNAFGLCDGQGADRVLEVLVRG